MLKEYSNEQFVNDFLKSMLDDSGMNDLPASVREQMLADLKSRLEDRFFGTILKQLNDDQVSEYRILLEGSPKQEQIDQFITKNIADPRELFSQTMLDFRADYLGTERVV